MNMSMPTEDEDYQSDQGDSMAMDKKMDMSDMPMEMDMGMASSLYLGLPTGDILFKGWRPVDFTGDYLIVS